MVKTFLVSVAVCAASTALAQEPQPHPPPQQQPSSQSTAGSQGQSSTAQPSSPGASSQQVVVNPPPSQQPSTQPPPSPPSSTTVVNPPPTYVPGPGYAQDEVVVRRRDERNPMATVATDAAYGGVAGLLVGVGAALVNQWDNWQRDVMVGAGAGVLVGAVVGVAHAAYDAREDRRSRRVAFDGMSRTDKDPVIARRPTVALAFRF